MFQLSRALFGFKENFGGPWTEFEKKSRSSAISPSVFELKNFTKSHSNRLYKLYRSMCVHFLKSFYIERKAGFSKNLRKFAKFWGFPILSTVSLSQIRSSRAESFTILVSHHVQHMYKVSSRSEVSRKPRFFKVFQGFRLEISLETKNNYQIWIQREKLNLREDATNFTSRSRSRTFEMHVEKSTC